MYPLSDKDLDRLSREAAEQYDVEQNTSGWDKLEHKLSKHMPEKGKKERRRFLFFIWLFALLSGGGLLWILTGNQTSEFITLKEGSSKPVLPVPSDKPGTESLPGDQPNDHKTPADQAAPQKNDLPSREQDLTEADKTKEAPEAINPSKLARINPSQTRAAGEEKSFTEQVFSGNDKRLTAKPRNTNKKPGNITSYPPPVDQSIVQKQDLKEPVSADDKRQNDSPTPSPSKAPVLAPDQNKVTADDAKKVPAEQANTSSIDKKASTPKTRSWFGRGVEIGLVGAPDMTNVKFTNTSKVGFNAGLQLGYRFANRWSVNAGVLYTRKNYAVEGRDFSPPKGTWLDNVQLDGVEGYCNMFDIPLNIRYDLTTGNRHRYFVSTGVSSYLMKKEDYHYYYQYANGNPGYRHRSGSSSEKHLGSILNISAGLEKKFGKHLSIQGEPYFKVPLAGLGFGNLKLNSYGVYFSVKFHTR